MADKSMAGLNTFEAAVETKVDTTKKLRIGIIGCGWIADAHIRALKKQPDVEIVAGCDLVPGRPKEFFESYGLTDVKTDYQSHEDFLATCYERIKKISMM